jgi:hypothetical protein
LGVTVSFPYDTPFLNNNKVDLDTYPAVADVNKVLAPEFNALISAINALAVALTEGTYLGLASSSSAVAPSGGMRLRNNGGVLEVSLNGGAYAPVLTSVHAAVGHVQFGSPVTVTGPETLVNVSEYNDNVLPLTGTGPVTLTATPLIANNINNPTRLTLFNESVSGGVTVPSGGSSGVTLRDSIPVELLPGDSLTLYYVTNTVPDTGTWYECGRTLMGH